MQTQSGVSGGYSDVESQVDSDNSDLSLSCDNSPFKLLCILTWPAQAVNTTFVVCTFVAASCKKRRDK